MNTTTTTTLNTTTTTITTVPNSPAASPVSDHDVTSHDVITMTSSSSRRPSTTPFEQAPSSPSSLEGLYYFHVVYLSVAIVVGVPGNAVVVAAYGKLKAKSSCDWYILYIGILDLIICLFRVPTHLAMETGHWQQHGTNALCKCVYWLSQSVISASVFLFGFIAIDRYIKVCRPSVVISARFFRNSIPLITLGSILFALPTLWMFANNAQDRCVLVPSRLGFRQLKIYYSFLFAAFIIMFVVVVICYTFIIIKARRSQQAVKDHRKRSRQSDLVQRREISNVLRRSRRSRRRRRNRVGVIHDGLDRESEVDGIYGERCSARTDQEGQEPSSQFSEQLSVSVIVRRLRNPTEKYLGDARLWDTAKPAPARPMGVSSAESSLVSETNSARCQTLQEVRLDTMGASPPKLIPRPPTRGGSFDNVLENFSMPGVSRGPAEATCTVFSLTNKQSDAARYPSLSVSKRNTGAPSVSKDLQGDKTPKTKTEKEGVFNTLNNSEISGLSGKALNSDNNTKQTTRISSLAERSKGMTNHKEGCSVKETVAQEELRAPSRVTEFGQTLSQINRDFVVHSHTTEAEHHTETWTLNAFQDTSSHNRSSSQLQNIHSFNSFQLPDSVPSVFVILSDEEESSPVQTSRDPGSPIRSQGDEASPDKPSLSRRSSPQCVSLSRTFRLTLLLLLVTVIFVLSWILPV
ncbi:hypothetical protein ACOMHN_056757 [Nucella lapillus]